MSRDKSVINPMMRVNTCIPHFIAFALLRFADNTFFTNRRFVATLC